MSDTNQRRLFLTGASGLLGRAIHEFFSSRDWEVYGTAMTRVARSLHKLDLKCVGEIEKAFLEFKPSFVIHCAAQRFPEKVDADPTAAENLNVTVTRYLAEISNASEIPFLYISTDYVFDGKKPPYAVTDLPCPINTYGKTKYQGEQVALMGNKGSIVLRIPVIYGPVEYLGESAITVLLEKLIDPKPSTVSNYEVRCPSYVDDIAHICHGLAVKRLQDPTICGIFHWCGKETFTKYEMLLNISQIFKLPSDHVKPMLEDASSSLARPFNPQLDTSRLEQLGIGQHTLFNVGIQGALEKWVQSLIPKVV